MLRMIVRTVSMEALRVDFAVVAVSAAVLHLVHALAVACAFHVVARPHL